MDLGNDRAIISAEEDIISSLPDELIHHILSFVDIKYAIQTSVLSSRWKRIWTFLPHLNFSSWAFPTLPRFASFVNHVLSHHNNQTNLHTVQLAFRGAISQVFVKKIANYAVSHNVQNLFIDCPPDHPRELPQCLFSSQSLKHLSLRTHMQHVFNLPKSPWNLPALTTVYLEFVSFSNDNTTKCLEFFSRCVNLKNLTLDYCIARGLEVFKIFAPQLANLAILHCSFSKCVISAPNLSSFDFQDGSHPPQISTDGFYSLDKVNLHIDLYGRAMTSRENAHRLVNLLQDLGTAKILTLCWEIIECLSTVPDLLELQPSPFSNLNCLKIHCDRPKKQCTYSAVPDYVRNYLLNNSPRATVFIELPKDPPKKSRKQVQEEARAKMKAEVEARIEVYRAEIEVHIEQQKAEVEAKVSNVSPSIAHDIRANLKTLLGKFRTNMETWLTNKKAEIESEMTNARSRKRKTTVSTNIQAQPDSLSTELAAPSQPSPTIQFFQNPRALSIAPVDLPASSSGH